MIQNGGQGQNSIPLASATDPDPKPFQRTPLPSVFTTGYRHLAFIISSETQSASDGQLPQRGGPLFDMTVPPRLCTTPGGRACGRSVQNETLQEFTCLNAFNSMLLS